MADFISREDAEQFICKACERPGCPRLWGNDCEIICRLNTIPAADVVEVVRCKDYIHAGDRDCPIDWPKNGEDYCSYGERRTDNGN